MTYKKRKDIPKLQNCTLCKKLFVSANGEHICRDCIRKLQDEQHAIVEYVRDHPKTDVTDIMKATGASLYLIRHMVRQGFFQTEGIDVSYPCERCGKPIATGKYCTDCLLKMRRDLRKTEASVKEKITRDREQRRTGLRMYSQHLKDK